MFTFCWVTVAAAWLLDLGIFTWTMLHETECQDDGHGN